MEKVTVTVQTASNLDDDRTFTVDPGCTIRDVINRFGNDYGYTRDMVAAVNNAQQRDLNATLQPGDYLTFRPNSKERGN